MAAPELRDTTAPADDGAEVVIFGESRWPSAVFTGAAVTQKPALALFGLIVARAVNAFT